MSPKIFLYSRVWYNDLLIKDGPHICQRSHKIIVELKIPISQWPDSCLNIVAILI